MSLPTSLPLRHLSTLLLSTTPVLASPNKLTFQPYITIALCLIYLLTLLFSLTQFLFHLLFNPYTRRKCGFRHFARLGFSLCLSGRLSVLISSFFLRTHESSPFWHLPNDLVALSFIFCHLFLIFYWLSCYAKIRLKGKLHKTRLRFYIKLMCVFVVSAVVLFSVLVALHAALFGVTSPYELYKWIVLWAYFPLVTLLLTLVFCFVALKLSAEMTQWISKQHMEYRYLRRIGVVIALALLVLYFKQIANAVIHIPEVSSLHGLIDENAGLMPFLFLVSFECIPTVVTLLMFKSMSPTGFDRAQREDAMRAEKEIMVDEHDMLLMAGNAGRLHHENAVSERRDMDPGLFI